ncbi:MAG: efflux RND transporter periplasmic adaptor subunit, partial [Myxococcales bacterium]|nr:efflux RND transporter periplasmic adaptor subunit [Myxococcales bacterium]
SMHPQIRMAQPGRCPICGMELIPASDGASDSHDEHGGRVTLSPRAQALARVATEPVRRTQARTEVRLLGRVDHDESRLRTITPWTGGRIDRLLVRVTGTRIGKNQVVARLYSPEIYTATRELALAAAQAKKLAKSPHGGAQLGASTLAAARTRLRLLGVADREIEKIERTGKAPSDIDIRAPFSGTVLERHVEEGQYVAAGTPLYSVADLSEVWVQIDAYESDLPHLHVGQEVELTVEALPGEDFVGKIAFIDPVVDRKQRTARVRVEVKNRDGQLRPGMFASAVIHAGDDGAASQLVIPSSAPLYTGRRSVVYVEVPEAERPTYELREVRLGPKAGPVYPVLAGLNDGERVVVRGAFLLDADLQLSGGRSMMTLGDDRGRGEEPALRVSPAFLETVAPIVLTYLEGQEALAADDLEGARAALGRLADAIPELDPPGRSDARAAWQRAASELGGHARQVATAETIAAARSAFEHVSAAAEALLEQFGNPTGEALRVAYCPMAFDSQGARWIQRDQALANPYYGASMLRCGELRGTLLPGERLSLPAEEAPTAGAHQH